MQNAVKVALAKIGKDQRWLAREIGLSPNWINQVITGRKKSWRVRLRIAKAMGASVESLFTSDAQLALRSRGIGIEQKGVLDFFKKLLKRDNRMQNAVKVALAKRGKDQRWLARATGLSPGWINQVIMGKKKSWRSRLRIAEAMNASVESLFADV